MFRSMRPEWKVDFCGSASDVLVETAKEAYDVVVAEVNTPGAEGEGVAEHLRRLHPGSARIIVLDHLEWDGIIEPRGPGHFFLFKPFEAEKLKAAISRACSMRTLLGDQALVELISRIDSLPSIPSLYEEVVREARSQEGSLAKVADIISKDVGMSAKLLQVVNSALFGFSGQVSSIVRAVNLLGLENIKALILSLKVFTSSHTKSFPCYSLPTLWEHSISVAMTARSIATQEGFSQAMIDEAFMAGMLHDVGKAVLLDKLPDECRNISEMVKEKGCGLLDAEQARLGTTHARVGAYLMGMWGLSESTVEAIAFHHFPGRSGNEKFGILTVVHLANAMEHGGGKAKKSEGLDAGYMEKLGISEGDG